MVAAAPVASTFAAARAGLAALPRRALEGALALRRACMRTVLCVLAAVAAALVSGPEASGQEHNATSPAAGGARDGDLADRVGALERAAAPQGTEPLLVSVAIPSVIAALAGAQSACLAVLFDRRRRRPMMAWSTHGEGRRPGRRDMPDGTATLMVRVTNVGDASAVDIESRTTTGVREPGAREARGEAGPDGPALDFVGSLHPEASADMPIALSGDGLSGIQRGDVAVLDIVLDYKGADGRAHSCGIAVIYSSLGCW